MIELSALSASAALPHLRRVERTHWYSSVRERARVTAEAIERSARERRPVEAVGRGNAWCLASTSPTVDVDGTRLRLESSPVRSRTPPPGFPAVDLLEGWPAWVKDLDCPHSYERVASGWLVSTDCGEWGASVDFVSDQGRVQAVAEADGYEFLRFGDKLLLIGGSDHLGLNVGHLLELYEDGSSWKVRWFAEPVGHVYETRVLSEGLLVVTHWGASIVGSDGTQREVRCVQPE